MMLSLNFFDDKNIVFLKADMAIHLSDRISQGLTLLFISNGLKLIINITPMTFLCYEQKSS